MFTESWKENGLKSGQLENRTDYMITLKWILGKWSVTIRVRVQRRTVEVLGSVTITADTDFFPTRSA
jgi:hypothetical protein